MLRNSWLKYAVPIPCFLISFHVFGSLMIFQSLLSIKAFFVHNCGHNIFSKLSSHAWYSMVGHFFSSLNCFTKQRFQTMVPSATILPHGNNTLYSEVKAHSRNSLAIAGFFTSLLSCGSSMMISFGLAPLIGWPLVTVSI